MSESIKLYQPSNGTEGDIFMGRFCFNCVKMPHATEAKNQCWILGKTFMYKVTDKKYPKQWIYKEGVPTCTSFKDREAHNLERRKTRKPTMVKGVADLFNTATPEGGSNE